MPRRTAPQPNNTNNGGNENAIPVALTYILTSKLILDQIKQCYDRRYILERFLDSLLKPVKLPYVPVDLLPPVPPTLDMLSEPSSSDLIDFFHDDISIQEKSTQGKSILRKSSQEDSQARVRGSRSSKNVRFADDDADDNKVSRILRFLSLEAELSKPTTRNQTPVKSPDFRCNSFISEASSWGESAPKYVNQHSTFYSNRNPHWQEGGESLDNRLKEAKRRLGEGRFNQNQLSQSDEKESRIITRKDGDQLHGKRLDFSGSRSSQSPIDDLSPLGKIMHSAPLTMRASDKNLTSTFAFPDPDSEGEEGYSASSHVDSEGGKSYVSSDILFGENFGKKSSSKLDERRDNTSPAPTTPNSRFRSSWVFAEKKINDTHKIVTDTKDASHSILGSSDKSSSIRDMRGRNLFGNGDFGETSSTPPIDTLVSTELPKLSPSNSSSLILPSSEPVEISSNIGESGVVSKTALLREAFSTPVNPSTGANATKEGYSGSSASSYSPQTNRSSGPRTFIDFTPRVPDTKAVNLSSSTAKTSPTNRTPFAPDNSLSSPPPSPLIKPQPPQSSTPEPQQPQLQNLATKIKYSYGQAISSGKIVFLSKSKEPIFYKICRSAYKEFIDRNTSFLKVNPPSQAKSLYCWPTNWLTSCFKLDPSSQTDSENYLNKREKGLSRALAMEYRIKACVFCADNFGDKLLIDDLIKKLSDKKFSIDTKNVDELSLKIINLFGVKNLDNDDSRNDLALVLGGALTLREKHKENPDSEEIKILMSAINNLGTETLSNSKRKEVESMAKYATILESDDHQTIIQGSPELFRRELDRILENAQEINNSENIKLKKSIKNEGEKIEENPAGITQRALGQQLEEKQKISHD